MFKIEVGYVVFGAEQDVAMMTEPLSLVTFGINDPTIATLLPLEVGIAPGLYDVMVAELEGVSSVRIQKKPGKQTYCHIAATPEICGSHGCAHTQRINTSKRSSIYNTQQNRCRC